MKSRKIALAVAVAFTGALCGGSYVLGQSQTPELTPAQQAFGQLDFDASMRGDLTQIPAYIAAYMKAPEDSAVVSQIIRTAFVDRDKPEGPVQLLMLQAAQNQKIIEQNAQILAALKAKPKS